MSAQIQVTRADEILLRALASVVAHQPELKRTGHLRAKTVALADRVRDALPKEAP